MKQSVWVVEMKLDGEWEPTVGVALEGTVEHNIHCKPCVIAPHVEQETTQVRA